MGKALSKLCTECFDGQEDNSIPLIETSSKASGFISYESLTQATPEPKVEENHPKQEYLFKIIENASIEFLSHVRCPFEEEGFVEILKKEKIRVHSKECDSGYMMKSEYILNCTASEFISLLQDIGHRKLWDENIEHIELVATLPEDITVTYIKYKKFLVISSRDVLLVNRAMRAHNGMIFVSSSCELDEYPVKDSAIRAFVDAAGYYLEPFENKIKVVGFTLGNAGGNIPKAFVKTAAASALPKFIASVEKAIKNKKW